MSFFPTPFEQIARARTDLRLGLAVVLRHGIGGTLVAAADGLRSQALSDVRALGAPQLAITAQRAQTLRARVYDGDLARLNVPADADVSWISAVIDPKDDLNHPMKGPFREVRDGDASLARAALGLMKSARLLPAAVLVPVNEVPSGVLSLNLDATLEGLNAPIEQHPIVSGRVPLSVADAGRVHLFRPVDGGDEHVVCEIGRPPRDKPALVRLHSACFTGDVLGSVKCDCGPQLHAAMARMGETGAGILLYLSQEGRGIGLANKLRAYALQDQGFDTVEANHRLGFEDDERDFRVGADLLKKLGFSSIRLMTNNPAKVEMMEAQGIKVVERVPL
ncbi:MAG: GTP cyclohydrolase II RibA, partial [Paracoccaceae bacterium]